MTVEVSEGGAIASQRPIARALGFPAWLADPERGLWRYGAAALFVVVGSLIAEGLLLGLHLTRFSVVLMCAVVLTANWLGARPALFAALLGFGCYDVLLLQPQMRAKFDSTEQLITLAIFLFVALLTGSLAGRVRDEGHRSAVLAANNRLLFQASRLMSVTDQEKELRRILVTQVRNLTGNPAYLSSEAGAPVSRPGWRHFALQADGETLGFLRWQEPEADLKASADRDNTIHVLCDLCAASIARARLAAQKLKLASAAQTERLQAALLSSISHDFRTPLSAIITSASSLQAFGDTFTSETRADLCATIQEEGERLNRFVAKLLHITRLDAGALHPNRSKFDLVGVVEDVSQRLATSEMQIFLKIDGDNLIAQGDAILFEHALVNVVENALRFSKGAPVTIEIERTADDIVVRVIDEGMGVPAGELNAIFDRFYRASNNSTPERGYGLGLSITRGLIEAMGGRAAASANDVANGLTINLTMPAAS